MESTEHNLFVLERINVPEKIILDKPDYTYTCGRAKDNEIVCLSLTVSRRHCIFFQSKNDLYVTDLKSSNGLFINGIEQKPFQTVKLQENDVIGVGCADVDVKDNTMFAYKLHVNVQPKESQENKYNTSPFSETRLNFTNTSNNVSDPKRKRGQKNHDTMSVPNKIPKLEETTCQLEKMSVGGKSKAVDESDIEIVHISLNNSTKEGNNSNCDNTKNDTEISIMLNTRTHAENNMHEVNHSKHSTKHFYSPITCKTESDPSVNTKNKESLVSSDIKDSSTEKENSVLFTSNNSEKSNRNIFQDVREATKKNIIHRKSTENQKNDNTKNINTENMSCGSKENLKHNRDFSGSNKIKTSNVNSSTNQYFVENNIQENVLPSNFIQCGNTMIKLEDELQLTDTDEEAIMKLENMNSVPLVSPIKLRKIQQEPKTKFSEDDVVNLSDSEDDIFPCSQLFDIGFGINTSVKNEVKEEPIETDNDRFSRLDDTDLVISLTDSEDEDNTWLQRLSRSQMFNENDEIDSESKHNIIKQESMEIEIIDIEDQIDASEQSVKKLQRCMDTSIVTKELEVKEHISEMKETNGLHPSNRDITEKMDVDFDDLSVKSKKGLSDSTVINKSVAECQKDKSLLFQQKETESSIDTPTSSVGDLNSSLKKRKSLEKKVPQIEAPYLPNRRRSNNCNKVNKVPEKAVKQKLTKQEKKQLEDKKKREQYLYTKEQKNRKILNKWADCLPPSKKAVTNLTKEERKALADNRKLKLQEIAMKEKEVSLEDNLGKKRIVSKPKAKVSVKTRSDFLITDQITSTSKAEEVTEKSKILSNRAILTNTNTSTLKRKEKEKECVKSNHIHKEAVSLQSSLPSTNRSTLGKIPKKTNSTSKTNTTAMVQKVPNVQNLNKEMKKITISVTKEDELKDKSKVKSPVDNQKVPSLSHNLQTKAQPQKKKKRVSFCAEIKTVREYEIDESNVLRKLSGKDAPLPVDKSRAVKSARSVMEDNAKLNEFLLRIFSWNPVWLEEQQHLKITAPVVQDKDLHVMLTHYKSYDEYYNIISPLLLLETWYGITKEFEMIEQDFRRPTLMCSIVEYSIQTNLASTNVYLTTLMLEVLVTKQDLFKQIHPVYGDLVFFEYVKNHEKGQTFHKVFAYVTDVHQTILTPLTHYNKDLKNYVKHPFALLTYTMVTKSLENNIPVNRVQRLRTVTYLRSNLRLVQALQYLPKSPLINLILNPRNEMYQLPTVSVFDTLITKDKLNPKQLEAVHRVTQTVIQKESKLCFIQGPPGTGKSKVIVNIVTQILYGNNRYMNNGSSLKMLVCAPSNAAIDEIVLRLLQIRSTIKQNRFKMVRIGRAEMMHPLVKDISVTELAKRDVKRTTASSTSIPSDSVKEEKSFLESKMNALRCEIANSHDIDEAYKKHIKMKLSDLTAKYELLNNRKPLNEISSKELVKLHRAAENRILSHADIITCTLSSCYTNQMESIFGSNKNKISVCIVDEATQSCEAETLIPLMLGVNILVLVGDPNQLPATVLSPQAKKLGLDQSIFSRVQNAFDMQPSNPIIMLDTQYRMHHEICSWPNRFFYGGKLKNATERNDKFPFYSYRILNLNAIQNEDNFSNTDEAEFVANMIFAMLMFSNLRNWLSYLTFGILTPYNNQKSIIMQKISEKISSVPESIKKKVKYEVNTVDGFQGQERDIIIMSCVRSQRIGFLSDRQRLCVALTRAKHSLILCGNFSIFMRDPMWNALLSDAKSRRVYFHVNATAQPEEIKTHVIKHMFKK